MKIKYFYNPEIVVLLHLWKNSTNVFDSEADHIVSEIKVDHRHPGPDSEYNSAPRRERASGQNREIGTGLPGLVQAIDADRDRLGSLLSFFDAS